MKRSLPISLCVGLLLSGLAPDAHAEIQEDTTRIGLQFGWRYQPNARFAEWTAFHGYPLAKSPSGGPSLLAAFGYRPLQDVEVALEVGWTYERFDFLEGEALVFNQIPVSLSVRWSPVFTKLFAPYVGAGFGYLLNFYSNAPGGTQESHAQGPLLLAGGVFDVSRRISVYVEYRYTLARTGLTDLGFMQVGGSHFFLGVQVNFPPEIKSSEPLR